MVRFAPARSPAWVRSPRSSRRSRAAAACARAGPLVPLSHLCSDLYLHFAGDLRELEFAPHGESEARGGRVSCITDET